jgi:glycosyltransferase involved in cell wall biosynthesis
VLDKSHILLLPLGDNIQSKYLTSPMKLFEYMATKIPVLAVDYPSVSSIATEDEIFLAKNSAKEFANRIVEITKCEYLNKKIAKMNEKAKEFSYENRSKKYYDILNN